MGIIIKTRKNEYYFSILIGLLFLLLTSQAFAQNNVIMQRDNTKSIEQFPAGWEQQSSGTSQNLLSVSFVDSSSGNTVGDIATLLRTDDGGGTWNPQSCGVTSILHSVSLYDSTLES